MVLEYMENDLEKISRPLSAGQRNSKRVFKIGDVKQYMLQLLKGLSAMHHKGILHRDLKLANLLVSKSGVLKLADFGLSRLSAKLGEPAVQLTPQVCTLWYRPPELLLTGCASLPAKHVCRYSLASIMSHTCIMPPSFFANPTLVCPCALPCTRSGSCACF